MSAGAMRDQWYPVGMAGGLPSTVVDVLDGRDASYVRVLRQGAISIQALEAAGFAVSDESEKSC